jgi:hypothetical protein
MSNKNDLQNYCQKNKLPLPTYKTWSKGLKSNDLDWYASASIDVTDKQNFTKETFSPFKSKIQAEQTVALMLLNELMSNVGCHNLKSNTNHHNFSSNVNHHNFSSNVNHNNFSSEVNHNNFSSDVNHNNFSSDVTNYDLISNVDKSFFLSSNTMFTNSHRYKCIYLIDLENKPMFKQNFVLGSLYIGFITGTHHSVEKYSNWHNCVSDSLTDEIKKASTNLLLYEIDGGVADIVDHLMTIFAYSLVIFLSEIIAENTPNNLPEIIIVSGDHAGFCTRKCLEKCLEWKKIKGVIIKNKSKI